MATETIRGRRRESLQSLRTRVAFGAINCRMFSDQLKSEFTMIEIFPAEAIHAIMTIQADGPISLDMRLHKCGVYLIMTGLANGRIEF